jgi:hypothetical protein
MRRVRSLLSVALVAWAAMLVGGAIVASAHPEHGDDGTGQRRHSESGGRIDTPLEADRQRDAGRAGQDDKPGGGKRADQHGPPTGHLPGSKENVELVGRIRFADAAPGRVSDVSALGNYAYLGAYSEPECERGGVYVINIRNPRRPQPAGFIGLPEDTYVAEGVQALHLDTESFTGDVLVNSNEICGESEQAVGGFTLTDITNPNRPRNLVQGFGDFAEGATVANQYHSAFAWQQGDNAYLIGVDDEELTDVDIYDITDPRHPRLIAETGLPDWPDAQEPLANGNTTFFHDVQVRNVRGTWTALLSYWDAGWVQLNVNDPANPVFMNDFDYPVPDTLTGLTPPEGNAHQAWYSPNGRFYIGTDEDFSPYRMETFEVVGGPAAGQYDAGEFGFTRFIAQLPDQRLNGPVVYGGYGCDARDEIPPASVLPPLEAGEEKIVVLQRGPVQDPNHPYEACRFDEKLQNALEKGYDAAIIANHHAGADAGASPDAAFCGSGDPRDIRGVCVGHRLLHLLFGRTPDYTLPYPEGDPGDLEPNVGELGNGEISATTLFDGWGYVRLVDASTQQEIDAYAIDEALDERFASGFGALSVHEVETEPDSNNLAYLSYYAGGFRVIRYGRRGIEEVGHYIHKGRRGDPNDPPGNDFWGIHPWTDRSGRHYQLLSDRDSGLWIFRYTGPGALP